MIPKINVTKTAQKDTFTDEEIPLGSLEEEHTRDSLSPAEKGELSVSGDMPDPESDDDTLKNAQDVGFQLNEDTEHPKEINMARDINAAERYIRTH